MLAEPFLEYRLDCPSWAQAGTPWAGCKLAHQRTEHRCHLAIGSQQPWAGLGLEVLGRLLGRIACSGHGGLDDAAGIQRDNLQEHREEMDFAVLEYLQAAGYRLTAMALKDEAHISSPDFVAAVKRPPVLLAHLKVCIPLHGRSRAMWVSIAA